MTQLSIRSSKVDCIRFKIFIFVSTPSGLGEPHGNAFWLSRQEIESVVDAGVFRLIIQWFRQNTEWCLHMEIWSEAIY